MNTHEYQAKMILQKVGVPMPPFAVITTLTELEQVLAAHLDWETVVLKVQLHAGGRGKAGGIKLCRGKDQILKEGKKLLGMKIVNQQTGPAGLIARQLLVTPAIDIAKEYYLGAIIDRQRGQAMLIASPEGGVEIEEVAKRAPERILTLPIPLTGKLKPFQLLRTAAFMGWQGPVATEGMAIISALTKAFAESDASLLEINPLVETKEGKLLALDAKLSIDDNALFRQSEIKAFYDQTQGSSAEERAHQHELAYVALKGDIGCMVNGAGLAMATMDIIHHFGGKPANFLDVGGGASEEKVAEGFKIILSDPQVKAILVNIFGGIMNCATLAAGIVSAANQLKIHVPLIVRLEGTNVEEGKRILRDSGLELIVAQSLTEAAQKAVAAIGV